MKNPNIYFGKPEIEAANMNRKNEAQIRVPHNEKKLALKVQYSRDVLAGGCVLLTLLADRSAVLLSIRSKPRLGALIELEQHE